MQQKDSCHQYAVCINTVGDYNCTCRDGFVGDGWTCERDGEIDASAKFSHDLFVFTEVSHFFSSTFDLFNAVCCKPRHRYAFLNGRKKR